MMRKLLKKTVLVVVLCAISFLAVGFYSYDYTFGINLSDFKIVKTPKTVSEHIIAYGVSASEVEIYYTKLRFFLGCPKVANKIKVYLVESFEDGSIGEISGHRIYGAFRKSYTGREDVIIYNGNGGVLVHELSHFFFAHMTSYKRDEDFAQLVERVIEYGNRLRLTKLLTELQCHRSGS